MKSSRERLLDAALELFSHYGYHGATTRMIAGKARVNEVTLFRLFGSKKALLHAVVGRENSAKKKKGGLRIGLTNNIVTDLACIGDHISRHMIARAKFMRLVLSSRKRHPDLWGRASRPPSEVLALLSEFFLRAAERGLVRKDINPETMAAEFMNFLLGSLVSDSFFGSAGGMGLDQARIRMHVDIFIHGISKTREGKSMSAKTDKSSGGLLVEGWS